jgi:major vault protein
VGGTTQRKTSNTPPRTITLDTKYDGVVSVDVWTGYAALLVRKNGERRVVVGPQTVLLEYDERPMMFELSTGTPKTDDKKLKTGFLRVINNSVSDIVTIETSDSFQAQIKLRYHLNFSGEPEAWFNVENYVQFLVERMRSMIRREAKRHTVRDLRDNAIDIVRNLVLGEPVEGAGRPGRTFPENGMTIFDLDVETPAIQGGVDLLLREAEQQTLRQSLELDAKERELTHRLRIEEIERQLQLASAQSAELRGQLVIQDLQRGLVQNLAQVEHREAVEESRLAHRACSTSVNPTSVYENKVRAGWERSDYTPIADGSGDRRCHGRASRQRKGAQVCRAQRTGRGMDPQ